ncbi:MAG TPA: hypothetical protein VIX59_13265 [Candidatus Binataceae bacterium]
MRSRRIAALSAGSLRLLAAVAMVASTLMTFGCVPGNSPRGVVDQFITARYVAIDLNATEKLCTGVALDQVHQEMKLIAGQKIDDTTRKPVVHYKLKAERDAVDHIQYVFRATIDVPDGGSFEKNLMITARKEGNTWKVSNFLEYD